MGLQSERRERLTIGGWSDGVGRVGVIDQVLTLTLPNCRPFYFYNTKGNLLFKNGTKEHF